MESQRLLVEPRLEQNAAFWVRLRRGLLLLFWISFGAMMGLAVLLVVRSYQPPARSVWHHRRVLCSYVDPPAADKTEDVVDRRQEIRGASHLGCGGLVLRVADMGSSVQSLVTEARKHDIRVVLDIVLMEEYNISREEIIKQAVRRWIQDGVSGFSLVGGPRDTLMTMVDVLHKELEGLSGEDRIVLLPDWLDEETAINKSHFLRTRPLPEWKPWEVNKSSEVMRTAWEVSSVNSTEPWQFMALTLPGTIKLSLSQTHPPPSWLRLLLYLRSQNSALYTGWLQDLSDNSTFNVLSHWGCSTLLITVNPSNQSQIFSLHLPHYTATAHLLLSTLRSHTRGTTTEDTVLLAPGEAQLLRLTPQE